MSLRLLACLLSLLLTSCSRAPKAGPLEERATFKTAIFDKAPHSRPAPEPPAGVFEKVHYTAPNGANVAYVTPVKAGPKRPAIVWIAGGLHWGIDEGAWTPGPRSNDQSASAFRDAGLVLMRPALRGCNDNPGNREYFLGEVADVVAAIDYVATRADVDTSHIYLGGHSTGGGLALLAAPSTTKLRGVIAFGPVDSPARYGKTGTALDKADGREMWLRSPMNFVSTIRVPTLVIEGMKGNMESFPALRASSGKAPITFVEVSGGDHFNVIAPLSELLAQKILAAAANGPAVGLTGHEAFMAVTGVVTPAVR